MQTSPERKPAVMPKATWQGTAKGELREMGLTWDRAWKEEKDQD